MVTSAGFKAFIARESSTWASGPHTSVGGVWKLLPIEATSGVDVVETIFDDARRGQAVVGFRQMEGVHRTEFSITGPFFPEETGLLLRSIIGSDSFTSTNATTQSFGHQFDLQSFPTAANHSFVLQFQDDSNPTGYQHLGCVCTQLTLRFNAGEGLVSYEAQILGYGMNTTAVALSTTDVTNEPFRGWHSSVAAGNMIGKLISGEVTIARSADLLFVARNNNFPLSIIPGLVEITGRLTASFDTVSDLNLYRNVTNENVRLQWTYGAGAALRALLVEFPKLSYTDSPAEIDRTGNNMTIGFNFRSLLGLTSGSAGPGFTSYGAANVSTPIRVALYNGTTLSYENI